MTLYTKDFIYKFAKTKLGVQNREFLMTQLRAFEDEYAREFPEHFPYDMLVDLVCELICISPEEYHSTFRYGKIPVARQLVCYILTLYGAKNKQICDLTGFSPARVNVSIKAAQKYVVFNKVKINEITEKIGL